MSSDDKAMTITVGVPVPSVSSDVATNQTHNQQIVPLCGPVAILWDMENCTVPNDVHPEHVAGNIRMALRLHPVIRGVVTMFSAYGDFNAFPRRLREGCQRTGVKLVDVPNTRKDASDKAILIDMFLFALDNKPPSSIMLISGDVDFAPALHVLGQRGYNIILAVPSGVGVSTALSNAGNFVWDWCCIARGEGFVPSRSFLHRGPNLSGYIANCRIGDGPDIENEEEAIVYRGISRCEDFSRANFNQTDYYNSSHISREIGGASRQLEYRSNRLVPGSFCTSSRCHTLPSGLNEIPVEDHKSSMDQDWWGRLGDLQSLKGEIVRLLEMSGGSLPLVRVPPEYLKVFGRPLYVAQYGAYKLMNLFRKMTDVLIVVGKGHKKLLCLRNFSSRYTKKCLDFPAELRDDKKVKGFLEENMGIGSSSDEFSDDEKNDDPVLGAAYDLGNQLPSIRLEIQELLVCYSCPIPLDALANLYKQRYKKVLDCQSVGVNGLEQLIEKLGDGIKLHEDHVSKMKFLVSSFLSG